MNTEVFTKLTEQTETAFAPFRKFNLLAVSKMEKLAALQIASLQDYSELSIAQLRAATDVTDVASFQDYLRKQADLLSAVREKVMADAKAISELSGEFGVEAKKLTEESIKAVNVKAA